VNYAVSSPVRVATDVERTKRIIELASHVPTPVWGRDELGTGDMWNSNSLISWLLAGAGIETDRLQPPAGGRAPGWDAGLIVAGRQTRGGVASLPGGAVPEGRGRETKRGPARSDQEA
jgi:hypothetical protein